MTIIGFHQDEEEQWVAELECGHNQHMRHDPPWTLRPWVLTEAGRNQFLGRDVACTLCCSRLGKNPVSNPIAGK
jgi:Protein of unknown function (DUF3565)